MRLMVTEEHKVEEQEYEDIDDGEDDDEDEDEDEGKAKDIGDRNKAEDDGD